MTSSSRESSFVPSFTAVAAAAGSGRAAAGPAGTRFTAAFGLAAAVPTQPGPPVAPAEAPAAAELVGAAPEQFGTVLTGSDTRPVTAASFRVDLREQPSLPGDLATRLRAEAQAAGYATGWSQGRQEAELAARAAADQVDAQVREAATTQAARVGQALVAVANAAGALENRMVPIAAELEDLIVGTAFALAQQIIGRELAATAEPGRDAIARALAVAPAGRPVTVRLHPTDYATVTQEQPGLVEIEGRTVSLLADATLRPGDAVAECDATTIDARIEPALMRVREVLGL